MSISYNKAKEFQKNYPIFRESAIAGVSYEKGYRVALADVIEWITNEQMSLYMQDIGNQVIRFQKECFIDEFKKQFEI